MKDARKSSLTAVLVMLASACILPLDVDIQTDDELVVRGSGRVVERHWPVADFHRIHFHAVGRLVIEQTGRETLSVSGDDNILDRLEILVKDRELHIGPEPGTGLDPSGQLVFRLEADEVERIVASGAVEIELTLGWQRRLSVILSGVASLKARGVAQSLSVDASGVTRFLGAALETVTTRVVTSGVAGAVVWATERLTVTASGVSYVRYLGSPELDVTVSGMATVEAR